MNNTVTYNLKDVIYISSTKLTAFNLFWGGFGLYSLSYVFKGNAHVNLRMIEVPQFIGLAIVLTTATFLVQIKIEKAFLKMVFSLYCFWQIIVILRGIHFNYDFLNSTLVGADYGILLYFVPLLILFPQNLNFYKKLFDVIIILGIFFFIGDILFLSDLLDRSPETQDIIELLARTLAFPCGFILLTYKYHSNKRNLFALSAVLVALLFSIYKARRGLSITLSSVLIFSFFSYLFSTKQKIAVIYLSVLILCVGFLYANSIYKISNNKLLSYIAQRGEEDTRTGVELYFYNDMQTKDWIMGRGMSGVYYCPGIEEDPPSDYRSLIETGYLQIILKGGIIRLILFLLIAIPAVFLGLFSSRNLLSKAASIWIIIALISLYPSTVESFSLQYMIVWISIGICHSTRIRRMPDYEMSDFFKGSNRPTYLQT